MTVHDEVAAEFASAKRQCRQVSFDVIFMSVSEQNTGGTDVDNFFVVKGASVAITSDYMKIFEKQ